MSEIKSPTQCIQKIQHLQSSHINQHYFLIDSNASNSVNINTSLEYVSQRVLRLLYLSRLDVIDSDCLAFDSKYRGEHKCIFPFWYKSHKWTYCTHYDSHDDRRWCSTKVTLQN